MTDLIRVNSTLLSGNSCSFKFMGLPFVGVLDLQYDQKRTPKIVHGARKDGLPLGWTTGKYEPGTVKVKMLRDSFDKLTTILMGPGLASYGDAEFPFVAQYAEPAQLPITVVMFPCRITSVAEGYSEGSDELVTDFEMATLSITTNGKPLYSIVRGLSL